MVEHHTETELYERITSVETHTSALARRLDDVETTLKAHGSILSDIRDSVSKHRSFNLGETIDVVFKTIMLIGALVAAVIYIAQNINASRLAVVEWRLDHPSQWSATIERPKIE